MNFQVLLDYLLNLNLQGTTQKKTTKKKRRAKPRVEREREDSPTEIPIDPDEPTYCLCEQVNIC